MITSIHECGMSGSADNQTDFYINKSQIYVTHMEFMTATTI